MSVRTGDERVEQYLAQLEAALADLPGARRRELVQEIAGHIAEAQAEIEPDDEVALLDLLDRIGDPEEIAAEARERDGVVVPERRRGATENLAIVLLLAGGFAAGIGWLVGVVLLWLSDVWTTRDKLIGTFVVPGGLALGAFLFTVGSASVGSGSRGCVTELNFSSRTRMTVCHGGATPVYQQVLLWALLVVLLAAPIVTAIYLARRSSLRVSHPA